MEVNKMTNAELLTAHRSIAANTSQWEVVMAAETELLRRLEHGQGAQSEYRDKEVLELTEIEEASKEIASYIKKKADGAEPNRFRECAKGITEALGNESYDPEGTEAWIYSMFHSYGLIPAAPPEQPQGSGPPKKIPCQCGDPEHCGFEHESAGLADRGEGQEWERNIHEQLDTLGAPRKSVDGFDFSINGRFAFLRYRAADPAQGQMSAREAIQKLREGLNGIECASYEQARKINTLMDEFAAAFARSQGEEKNG